MSIIHITGSSYTEQNDQDNWAAEYLSRKLNLHKELEILDHPDGSVTKAKLSSALQRDIDNTADTADTALDLAGDNEAAINELTSRLTADEQSAADEHRRIYGTIGGLQGLSTADKSDVVSAINEVYSNANTAQTAADNAQTTANTAQTAADNAQDTADGAQTAVDSLTMRYEVTDSIAKSAYNSAQEAVTKADNAQQTADKTQTEAERLKYYGDKDIVPSNESYFTVNETGETITGLTDTGKTQTELIIPYEINGVEITAIQDSAFIRCSSLTSIDIPNSVTSIGHNAFNNCTGLTSINIPNNVTSIGSGVFAGCTSLTSINIPDSVTSIGSGVFAGCTSLTDVKISNRLTSIGMTNFNSCTSLKSINIPDNITDIGSLAFRGCTSLTSINIPDSVTSIGNSAFKGCTSLTSINIPNSVTSIGIGSFGGCTNLTIYCEQGSYAETYAKEENIPVVYTDVKPTSINPIVKTAIEEITSINTIYDLGVQTELTMTLPSGQVGNFIEVDFISGETATTLTVNSSSGLIGFDLIPGTNTIYTLYFEWGVTGYDGTSVTYGWRFNYSEYSMDV
jgi:hypothetical protein